MKAKTARELARRPNGDGMDVVFKIIEHDAKMGMTSTEISMALIKEPKILQNLGYKLKARYTQNDGNYYEVRW